MIDKQQIDRQFDVGLNLLERRKYPEALEIFDEIITKLEDFQDNEDYKITYESSFNNRGMARCKIAISQKDINLYEKGLDDFKKSLELSGYAEDELARTSLFSWQNIQYSTKEMQVFERAVGDGLQAQDQS
ncbi:hypothetical protein [Chitinophaga sp. CB10]|uniref:hypothetical protein n=1 Tax=Chitinophaga sp. CB10 TaxID=1891659 RepID=UPI0025BD7408|nr:hypothetical protein [Chitinophaga sp. CB10]